MLTAQKPSPPDKRLTLPAAPLQQPQQEHEGVLPDHDNQLATPLSHNQTSPWPKLCKQQVE